MGMSTEEILAELSKLKPDELAQIQARLDELAGNSWLDSGKLSDREKAILDESIALYQLNPSAGSSWSDATSRIRGKLQP